MTAQQRTEISMLAAGLGVILTACSAAKTDQGKAIPAKRADLQVAAAANATPSLTVAFQPIPAGAIFESAADTAATDVGSLDAKLRRGYRYSDGRDWPATLSATVKAPNGERFRCTAALIGPQVLLTAAHCVPASNVIAFALGGTVYATDECTTPAQYITDPSADFALCRIKNPVAPPSNGFRFESVSLKPMDALVGKAIMLVGYGCTGDVEGASGQYDGKFGFGFNTVDETSNAAAPRRLARGADYADFYKPKERNNLFTPPLSKDGIVADICPGDSGGPVFSSPAGTAANSTSARRIIGLNSRVMWQEPDATPRRFGESVLSATGGPFFANWATDWLRKNKVVACGIDGGALPNCRS